jgi:hypothetical protein
MPDMQATMVAERRAWTGRLPSKLAAACGTLFPLAILIGDDAINQAGEAPDPQASIAAVNDYLRNAADAAASGSYWVGRGIGVLAFVALLIFAAHLAQAIRRREGDAGMLATLVLGAGVVAAALPVVSAVAQFAAVTRADEGIDPEVARALLDVSFIAFVLAWLPLAVLLGAVAVAGLRFAVLPRWLAIAAGVLAAGLLAGLAGQPADAAFMPIMLTWLWFIVTGVVAARRA